MSMEELLWRLTKRHLSETLSDKYTDENNLENNILKYLMK